MPLRENRRKIKKITHTIPALLMAGRHSSKKLLSMLFFVVDAAVIIQLLTPHTKAEILFTPHSRKVQLLRPLAMFEFEVPDEGD